MADRHPLVMALGGSRPQLSAGITAADPVDRPAALQMLAQRSVQMVHVDVTDERFTGRATGSAEMVADLATPLIKDVHLMVADPRPQIERFVAAGADAITVHVEADDPRGALAEIGRHRTAGNRSVLRGLALWPQTPIRELIDLIDTIDLALVLGVSLEDRGRRPFESGLARVRTLRSRQGPPLIAFDGGVTPENAGEVAACGCDFAVSGSAIFRAGDPAAALERTLTALSCPTRGRGA